MCRCSSDNFSIGLFECRYFSISFRLDDSLCVDVYLKAFSKDFSSCSSGNYYFGLYKYRSLSDNLCLGLFLCRLSSDNYFIELFVCRYFSDNYFLWPFMRKELFLITISFNKYWKCGVNVRIKCWKAFWNCIATGTIFTSQIRF